MIIEVPTGSLTIKSDPVVCIVVHYFYTFTESVRSVYMNNIVEVDFARGPPACAYSLAYAQSDSVLKVG